jgi:hypothetical protein
MLILSTKKVITFETLFYFYTLKLFPVSNNIGKKLSIIKNAVITITKQQEPQNVFPQEFKCDFNDENNNQISFIFERVVGLVNKIPSKVSNIYTEGTDGKLNLADTKTNDVSGDEEKY